MTEPLVEELVAIARAEQCAPEALEAAKVVLLHDVLVATSARSLTGELLEEPYEVGAGVTDLATGGRIDMVSAVVRNGQLVHSFTQDDTLLHAMTHVGATSIPILLAHAQAGGVQVPDLLRGFSAAFTAAEVLGEPIAAALAARGIRPTPVIGPVAAVVGVASMERWPAERVARAIARVAATAFGTAQAWVDGSQEWLFHITAAGSIALAAARSSARDWQIAEAPFSGAVGLFAALGVQPGPAPSRDARLAVTRASIKRFPACAINQVPMTLLRAQLGEKPADGPLSVRVHLCGPEARYPGLDRAAGLQSWSARLMSLPYCLAVVGRTGGFTVDDLRNPPAALADDDVARIEIVASDDHTIGSYTLEVESSVGSVTLDGSVAEIGAPTRAELDYAARSIVGEHKLAALLACLDAEGSTADDFVELVVAG